MEKLSPEVGLGRWGSRRGISGRGTSKSSRVGNFELRWRKWSCCRVWSREAEEGAEKLLRDLSP